MVARGEVWWYEEPGASRRPYCIITRTDAIEVLNRILAVPATTTIRGIPTEVRLDESNGMPRECVLTLDNTTLIRPSLCTEHVTTLDDATMAQVCQALENATAC